MAWENVIYSKPENFQRLKNPKDYLTIHLPQGSSVPQSFQGDVSLLFLTISREGVSHFSPCISNISSQEFKSSVQSPTSSPLLQILLPSHLSRNIMRICQQNPHILSITKPCQFISSSSPLHANIAIDLGPHCHPL